MALTAVENARFAYLLDGLDGVEWAAPTDCTGWNVRALVVHVPTSSRQTSTAAEASSTWRTRGGPARP
jgi:hypothetical protein